MSAAEPSPSLASAVGHRFRPTTIRYTEHDAALYALAIGAAEDTGSQAELQYTYELHAEGFNCFPTFATTFPLQTLTQMADIPGQGINLMEVIHGEQYLEVLSPLPASGVMQNEAMISHVYDKGSGAIIVADIVSSDAAGQRVALNRASIFVRGRGNFGGERGPSGKHDMVPEREADATRRQKTRGNQALLFRLASGDLNPMHADARFATLLGFERPILHGLCTYGYAARAVLSAFGADDPLRFRSIKARFSRHLFPGETIETAMWQVSDTHIQFESRVVEREELILTHGAVMLDAP